VWSERNKGSQIDRGILSITTAGWFEPQACLPKYTTEHPKQPAVSACPPLWCAQRSDRGLWPACQWAHPLTGAAPPALRRRPHLHKQGQPGKAPWFSTAVLKATHATRM
jgi:hypothetical protein